MDTWEIAREIWITLQDVLEFGLKYRFNRERARDMCARGERKWFSGNMNGPLGESMGGLMACDRVCLGMVCVDL